MWTEQLDPPDRFRWGRFA